ncbi:hypothetical protein [Yoonia sp. SDW83-1]|uniref:hypothetical protein n=1 Tax=Yoonia sp. SDW83-1 TaxID=3366945 RepID=UPI00398C43EA
MSDAGRKPHALSAPLLFLLGFGLFMFTRRSEIFPNIQEMIVIAPIFILRFSRSLPTRRAMVLTTFGFVLSMNFALRGLFDFSDTLAGLAFNVLRSTLLALLFALPYLIDRWLYARFGPSIWAILAFPIAVTAMMFLSSMEGPFDGVSAKTALALGPDALRQLYALTGLWGFIFLWSLPPALINHLWARRFPTMPSIAAVVAFSSLLAGLIAYGTNRLGTQEPRDTVRLAAIVLLPEDGVAVSMEPFFAEKRVLPYDETLARIASATADAVAGGAQIVSFQEHLLTVMEPDVEKLRADYQRIAAENAVWLSIT